MSAHGADHGLLGRLGVDSLQFIAFIRHPGVSEAVAAGAAAVVVLGVLATVVLLTRYRAWGWLWSKWLTSVDHKRIGIMYIVLAFVMLVRGVIEGALMRMQQADGLNGGFLAPDHFAELFSTHGTIMIFFVAMPFIAGFINYVMPLQIGARDVSYPTLNQVSLALTAAGAALVMISLVFGRFSFGGWTAYPPYTESSFQPGPGPDYWIWSIAIAGLGSTLTGLNFVATIYKQRAPDMSYFRMPLFTWTAFCTSIILVFAMPPLTVACLTLALDRYLDFHFFTNDLGGNMMNYANLFWLFGHPEVYLLILPAYGIFSEVVATFSGKRLFGYKSLVLATMAISVLSFTVWLHHFFTMGQGANLNAAFGVATMFIAVPTGVKMYDWMLTMYRGSIRMTVPMIYTAGFMLLFVIGGLTGVILANPTIDYQVHNTLFLVAHFHNVLIPGVLFAMLAGWHYWFPKMFGFRLDETWGRIAAFLWIPGFALTFFPLYVLGLMGFPRRSVAFSNPDFVPYMLVAALGAAVIICAVSALVIQLVLSIRNREKYRVPVGDPWDGRTLEWSVSAPPPEYNFAATPAVPERDSFAAAKAAGTAYARDLQFTDIELPRNTWLGPAIGLAATAGGFALVFHIWWLVIASLLGAVGSVIVHSFDLRAPRIIPAVEVERDYGEWVDEVERTQPVDRTAETSGANVGRASGRRGAAIA